MLLLKHVNKKLFYRLLQINGGILIIIVGMCAINKIDLIKGNTSLYGVEIIPDNVS